MPHCIETIWCDVRALLQIQTQRGGRGHMFALSPLLTTVHVCIHTLLRFTLFKHWCVSGGSDRKQTSTHKHIYTAKTSNQIEIQHLKVFRTPAVTMLSCFCFLDEVWNEQRCPWPAASAPTSELSPGELVLIKHVAMLHRTSCIWG